MMTTRTRKALPTLLREAAAAQGKTIASAPDPTPHGRLGFRIDGGEWMTPGEAAKALGVVWRPTP